MACSDVQQDSPEKSTGTKAWDSQASLGILEQAVKMREMMVVVYTTGGLALINLL